jgi:hypothetical protein
LAGTAMLGLAAFAPFLLLNLIPIAIDAGQLSQGRRQSASMGRAARELAGARSVLYQQPSTASMHRAQVTGVGSAAGRPRAIGTPIRPAGPPNQPRP